MADVFLNLIDPLEERYVWKDKSEREIEVARRDMVEAFKHHTVEDLKAAQRYIVLHRKFSTMPNVADVADVISRMMAERTVAENKSKRGAGVPVGHDAFMEGLAHEKESAKAWARDWLRWSPLGQESLRDGWCRDLFNLVWQIRLNRLRANKRCEFEDVKLNDIATQSKYGNDLIKDFQAFGRNRNADLERRIVLKEEAA
jgi:hypothetical protein